MPAKIAGDDEREPGEPERKSQKLAIVGAEKATRNQNERGRGATRRWTTEAAGLPCTIEHANDGCWVVTIASATTSRRERLTEAILEASGGLVSEAEAFGLVVAIKYARDTKPGQSEQLTVKLRRHIRAGR